jgi:hypothetical protein
MFAGEYFEVYLGDRRCCKQTVTDECVIERKREREKERKREREKERKREREKERKRER